MTDRKEYMRKWREENKDKVSAHGKKYKSKKEVKHKDKVRLANWAKTDKGRKRRAELNKQYKIRLRTEMIGAYGGMCECCGESQYEFLTLEHKNGGGKKHREAAGGMLAELVKLKKAGWPKSEHTVLCYNCNMARRFGQTCPHRR